MSPLFRLLAFCPVDTVHPISVKMTFCNALSLVLLLYSTISGTTGQDLAANKESSDTVENNTADSNPSCLNGSSNCAPEIFLQNCFSVTPTTVIVIPLDFAAFLTDEKDAFLTEIYGQRYFNFNATAPTPEFSKNGKFTCGPRMEEYRFHLQVPIDPAISELPNYNDTGIGTGETNSSGIYRDLIFTANGYMEGFNESNGFTFYIPPELYCVSRFTDDSVSGKFCMPKTKEAYPIVRRCLKPLRLRRIQTDLFSDPEQGLELNITDYYEQDPKDLFQDIRFPNNHLQMKNPVFLQRSLKCDDSEKRNFVSDPEVLSAGGNSVGYQDFHFHRDIGLAGRDSGSVPWKPIKDVVGGTDEYCIDTFQTESDKLLLPVSHRRRILVYCVDSNTMYNSDLSHSQRILVDIQKYLLIFSDVVLAAIIITYIVIWRKQNVHGRTAAVFVLCMFIYFLTLTFSLFETFPYASKTCTANAVIYHFAVLGMYSWMAILNFDVWSTITSMVAASQRTKGNKRFALYCLVGFGCPLIVVCISLGLHFSYPLDTEGIILPNYGYHFCIIRQGVYVYYQLAPLSITFLISVAFGVTTLYTLLQYRRSTRRIKSSSTKAAQNQCTLILKLFVLMGTTWGLEMIMLLVYGERRAEWPAFIVACYHCLVTGFFFWIFVVKREVVDHISKTIPGVDSIVSWVDEKRSMQSHSTMHSAAPSKSSGTKATDVDVSSSTDGRMSVYRKN